MTRPDGLRWRARRVGGPRLGNSETGQTLVLFALFIVVLIGMVGLGLDGGRLYDERRRAQNAADHAATTAAHAFCVLKVSEAEAVEAGEDSAATNGYDGATNNIVTVAYVSGTRFTADIATTIPTTFAQVMGFASMDTGAQAEAECTDTGGADPGAIYAGGDNCTGGKFAFESPGSTNRVYGGVHANSDARVGGANNRFTNPSDTIDDPFEYVGTLTPSLSSILSNGNTFQSGYPKKIPMPSPQWPDGWAPSDVAPLLADYQALAIANGTFFGSKVTSITKDGVYYTTHSDGMDIGSITGSARNVVLVAPNGPIKISASSKTLNPFEDPALPRENILMLSNKIYTGLEKCDKFTISISGSSSNWNGILWAPGGLVEFSGSDNSAVNGGVVGWAVRLNGSNLTIQYNSDLFESEPDILLLE